MAGDFLVALIYLYIVWCVGEGILFVLGLLKKEKHIEWLAFAAGFSVLTLLSTFLYFVCGLPVEGIRAVWLVSGFLITLLFVCKKIVGLRSFQVFGLTAALFFVLLIPGILGKDQYYVYRGNCTDQFTYIEEAVVLSSHAISWYEDRTEDEIAVESDVLQRGYDWVVEDRPSAGLMIAMMCRTGKGEIFWVAYLYRMFVQAIILGSFLYLFCIVKDVGAVENKMQKIVWTVVAGFYCIGFWGQIQYDIDAVSQMSSIAVLMALTAVFFDYLRNIVENRASGKAEYILMLILASAGLALYLENALVHGGLYLMTGIVLVIWEKRKLKGKEIVTLAGIPIISLGVLVLVNYRILHFLRLQIATSVSDGRQEWASYFNTWWLGKHGIAQEGALQPVSRLINFVVSLFGMYNITVDYDTFQGTGAWILTGLIAAVGITMIVSLFRCLLTKETRMVRMLWVLTLVGMTVVIGMIVWGKYWSAGKLLYYVSPYLYAFLALPLLGKMQRRSWIEGIALCSAVIMIASNGGMVLERVYDMKVNYACAGYRGNYPSDMIGGLKPMARFEFDTEDLKGIDGVIIEDLSAVSDHQIYLQYLKVKLTHAHIPFQVVNDVDRYNDPLNISDRRQLEGTIRVIGIEQDNSGRYMAVIKNPTEE